MNGEASYLVRAYRRSTAPVPVEYDFTIAAGNDAEIAPAPGAGKRLIVVGGTSNANTAGLIQLFHTDTTAGNEITGDMTVAAGVQQRFIPSALPENTPLVLQATTANIRGKVNCVIV